jgi:hypothetical protein
MTTNNFAYAQRIGSVYTDVTYSYCADDNVYWPKEINRTAWACAIDAREQRLNAIYAAA